MSCQAYHACCAVQAATTGKAIVLRSKFARRRRSTLRGCHHTRCQVCIPKHMLLPLAFAQSTTAVLFKCVSAAALHRLCTVYITGTGCEVPSQCSGCDAGNARTRAQRRPASVGARAPRGTAAVPGGTLAPGPELSDKSFWRSVTDPFFFVPCECAKGACGSPPKRVAQNKPLCATRAHRARQRTKVRAPSLALSPTNIVTVPFRKCNPAAHTPLCRHPRYM